MFVFESEIAPSNENELGISWRDVSSDDEPFSVGEDETDLPTPKVYGLPKHESSPVLEEYERKGNCSCYTPYERKHIKILTCHHKSISICLLCFFLIHKLPEARSLLVKVPNNTVVLQSGSSETIRVPCKSDQPDPLGWYVKRNPISEKQALYNGYYLDPDAKSYCTVITDEPGANHLLLKKRADIAQTYICFEPGTLAEASADILFIVSNLTCYKNLTEDLVHLTCSVEFRGNWAPTLEWKNNDGENVLHVGVNTVIVPNQRVISTLVMPILKSSRSYICTTKFDISGKPHKTTASNVPKYNQRCSVSTKPQGKIAEEPAITTNTMVISSVTCVATFVAVSAICIVFFKRRQRRAAMIRNNKCFATLT